MIRIDHGSECASSEDVGRGQALVLDGRADLPSFATDATVFLNGWRLTYLRRDHEVAQMHTILTAIRVEDGVLRWRASGVIRDRNFDDHFEWCYTYTTVAWNRAEIDALADHAIPTVSFVLSAPRIDEDTAQVTALSFKAAADFADKTTVAALPQGFGFDWGGGKDVVEAVADLSNDSQEDHHLLQLAFSRGASETFIERDRTYDTFVGQPDLPTAADRVEDGFVSWETQGIFKDNSPKRDFLFQERFSIVAGDDVFVVQPPFAVRPVENADGLFSGCASTASGLRTTSHIVEHVPYEYVVPVLTGWNLQYHCEDRHVTDVGIFLQDIAYEKAEGAPTGTLRYSVSSVLSDRHSKSGHIVRSSVHLLAFKRAVPRPAAPDLVPFDALDNGQFCSRDGDGRLSVFVANKGAAAAGSSTTTVSFGTDVRSLAAPALPPGQIQAHAPVDLPADCFDPDCEFTLTVDADNAIPEADESNNVVTGVCPIIVP